MIAGEPSAPGFSVSVSRMERGSSSTSLHTNLGKAQKNFSPEIKRKILPLICTHFPCAFSRVLDFHFFADKLSKLLGVEKISGSCEVVEVLAASISEI